jgi:hypothetical protein
MVRATDTILEWALDTPSWTGPLFAIGMQVACASQAIEATTPRGSPPVDEILLPRPSVPVAVSSEHETILTDLPESGRLFVSGPVRVEIPLQQATGSPQILGEAVNSAKLAAVRYVASNQLSWEAGDVESNGVLVTMLADGGARIEVRPAGKVGFSLNLADKLAHVLPFGSNATDVTVSARQPFRGPGGKQLAPGTYRFDRGALVQTSTSASLPSAFTVLMDESRPASGDDRPRTSAAPVKMTAVQGQLLTNGLGDAKPVDIEPEGKTMVLLELIASFATQQLAFRKRDALLQYDTVDPPESRTAELVAIGVRSNTATCQYLVVHEAMKLKPALPALPIGARVTRLLPSGARIGVAFTEADGFTTAEVSGTSAESQLCLAFALPRIRVKSLSLGFLDVTHPLTTSPSKKFTWTAERSAAHSEAPSP